jgi:hypothetical protein
VATAAACGLVAVVSTPVAAVAAPTPPFEQCPAIGHDASCGTLIVIDEDGRIEAFNDPRVGAFSNDDTLIGVQNESMAPVRSIHIDGGDVEIFKFDGNGICSGIWTGTPEGCPFGPTGYEGPGVAFDREGFTAATVEFAGEGLAPGASTYFSLEWFVQLGCEVEGAGCRDLTEPPSLTTTLSGAGRSGKTIVVPDGTTVTARATLSGAGAGDAGGTIEYDLYADSACTRPVGTAGTAVVTNGAVPPSDPETLPPGTYFWRAAFRGSDNRTASSQSSCPNAIEVVEPRCSAAKGVGHLGPRGAAGLNEANHLSTSGSPHLLDITRPGLHVHLQSLTSASCVDGAEFSGRGPAVVNGVQGYVMSFTVDLAGGGVALSASVEKEGSIVLGLDHERLNRGSKERFS